MASLLNVSSLWEAQRNSSYSLFSVTCSPCIGQGPSSSTGAAFLTPPFELHHQGHSWASVATMLPITKTSTIGIENKHQKENPRPKTPLKQGAATSAEQQPKQQQSTPSDSKQMNNQATNQTNQVYEHNTRHQNPVANRWVQTQLEVMGHGPD